MSRTLYAIGLAWMAASCTRWEPVPVAPQEAESEVINRVRLGLRDGTARVLYDVTVRNDSIIGLANRKLRTRIAYSRD